jgi:hypothetical protein
VVLGADFSVRIVLHGKLPIKTSPEAKQLIGWRRAT